MQRRGYVLAAAALVIALAGCANSHPSARRAPPSSLPAAASTAVPTTAPRGVDLCPYRGLGTWVDVYDYMPGFAQGGDVEPVKPNAIATMKAVGVHTLYLQAAKDDPRSPDPITDRTRVAGFLRNAHAAGIKVVAWYLPTHTDLAVDLEHVLALVNFTAGKERFDGIALDIEALDEKQVGLRNDRLLALATALDEAAGTMPIGAIVYPPVLLDVINPDGLWPGFPWQELAKHVDVWLPMAYWTFRNSDSPYRDAYRYSAESITRLRDDVGDPGASVHVIGGGGDGSTSTDYEGFRKAAREHAAIGFSIYDFNTLASSGVAVVARRPRQGLLTRPRDPSVARFMFVLRGRWLVGHVLVIVVAVAFVALGFWQLARHHEKQDKVRASAGGVRGPRTRHHDALRVGAFDRHSRAGDGRVRGHPRDPAPQPGARREDRRGPPHPAPPRGRHRGARRSGLGLHRRHRRRAPRRSHALGDGHGARARSLVAPDHRGRRRRPAGEPAARPAR